jgi:polygalacturonase
MITSRRTFFQILGAGAASPLLRAGEGWDQVPAILARIRPPAFPKRDFPVTRYGAKGDGKTDSTQAFRKAIAECSAKGGGRVVVPEGRYLTGPIHLLNKVNLHVTRDATILFSQNYEQYLPLVFTRWEGVECMNYSPMIYAFGQKDIAITGEGTLDGQAGPQAWWPWVRDPVTRAARNKLIQMAEERTPVEKRVFGPGSLLRTQFIQPYRCENVLIEGVKIRNSPMWEVHPVLCRNVTVRRLDINTHGPNNDGCDPESCTDVLIEGCLFDTGDDCIALKSGRNEDGRRIAVPIENVIVRKCIMRDGHGGVTIGSEISGGARNIFAEDCNMSSPRLDRALRLKNNAMRGGLIENVSMRNTEVGELADAVLQIDFRYEEGARGPYKPVARNIEMRNVTSKKSRFGISLRGLPNAPIENVHVQDCVFENVEKGNVVEHVNGLTLKNVRVNGSVIEA